MDHKVKKLPKSEVEIKITITEEEMQKFNKQAVEMLSKDVKVKGFRPGKVPLHILEDYIDKKYIKAQAQELAIKSSYVKAVIAEKLEVVSRPKVKVEEQEPFSITATVAVMPEVKVKDHKSIKIDKKEAKVSEKDIEEVLEDIKKRGTAYKEVDRKAKKGDRVEIDFEGFDEKGKSVPSTKSKNHPVIIGQGGLVPGFEENIIGLKKGEEKEFDITFPKDYFKKDFQKKKLKFKIKVHLVEEGTIPDLNEELIEKFTGKKQKIADFKKEIENNIKSRKEIEVKQERENKYIEALLKKTSVELPDSLIDEESEHILHEMKNNISQKGMDFEKFLEQSKTTLEELKKKYRGEAEKRLKVRLALKEVIKEEEIKITKEEVKKEIEKIKSFYPKEQHEKIEKDFEKGELGAQVQNRLTLRKFFEKVL